MEFLFTKTSFILESLYEIPLGGLTKNLKTNKVYYNEEGKNGEKNRH